MGLYDSDRRYRRRSSGGLVRAGFYLATLGVVFAFAYQIGVEKNRERVSALEAQLQQAADARAGLERQVVQLDAAAQTAQAREAALLDQYHREVPQGDLADLMVLAAMRLDSGVSRDRLAFMIASAGDPVNCTDPETRTLRINTPSDQRANATISFARDRITVSGRGMPAAAGAGVQPGDFDPAQEVSMVFTVIGGAPETVTGLLPLHHSVALGQTEYRFAMTAGEPGQVRIVADSCALPAPPER